MLRCCLFPPWLNLGMACQRLDIGIVSENAAAASARPPGVFLADATQNSARVNGVDFPHIFN